MIYIKKCINATKQLINENYENMDHNADEKTKNICNLSLFFVRRRKHSGVYTAITVYMSKFFGIHDNYVLIMLEQNRIFNFKLLYSLQRIDFTVLKVKTRQPVAPGGVHQG